MTNHEKYENVMETIRGTLYVGLGIFVWVIGIMMANAWYEAPLIAFGTAAIVFIAVMPIYCLIDAIIMEIYMEKDFRKDEAE